MSDHSFDRTKSIEEIEGSYWSPPTFDSTLAIRGHSLRHKPINELDFAQISVALIQQIGVSFVAIVALEHVERNPFVESKYYPGDILYALLNLPKDFWDAFPELRARLERVYQRAEKPEEPQDDFWRDTTLPAMRTAHARFCGDLPSRQWYRPLDDQGAFGTWGAGKPA